MQEERTESVWLYVTPKVKKELELCKDSKELQEKIIKSFIHTETDWLTDEIKSMNEITVKYHAKLLGIKDSFNKVQGEYITNIESLINNTRQIENKVSLILKDSERIINNMNDNITRLENRISSLPIDKLERFINVIQRFNSMSEDEKNVLKMFINSDVQ